MGGGAGREGRGRLHRGADRVGPARRRRRPLPGHDPQGQAVPADAAAGARLLPLAPAPRDQSRGLAASRRPQASTGAIHSRPAVGSGRVSTDTDKLIRQLSLVAFLMAERRAITARDVKSNVEGYSEMSDEAFARRFYSDRAELLSLGVPLQSQRDEFTGEELYTLRSEQYFLPKLELEDEELAALQTAFYLLEGKFAYAEPLRLALQNLALGRPGFSEAPTETASRVEVLDPDYSPETPGRLAKLENAISKQRTVRFDYWSISRDEERERTLNPYALLNDNGLWYVVGHDLDREEIRTFRVSRIRGDIKFATRRERDFRAPTDFDVELYRGRPPWQIGDVAGTARIEVLGDTAWWVRRTYGATGRLDDGVFVTDYSSIPQLASWVLRQNGRAVPLEPAAIRLALEYVGPMIAADAHSPLSRVRNKLEETFGQFELARTPEPNVVTEEVDLVSTLARGMRERKLVEIEYQKEADSEPSTRLVEPYSLERELPNWYVHTWDRTSDGPRSFRLDRMRSAKVTRERFEAREGFEPTRLSDARTAKVLYDEAIARWAIERGARPLADGSAIRDLPVGSDEWLESEVLSLRGEATLLEPDELRHSIAARAKALAKELGVERMRARA